MATNAGGICCVKYGVTRDYVLGLQVVTGTGELVRLGRRTAKGVAGYDLTGLMVGSEGTLGMAHPALERLGPVLTEDVCVPKGAVAEMLGRIEAIGLSNDVLIANIAHAGDGNLHPLLVVPAGDDAARARAEKAFTEIIDAALALGGTVTGEHGVGLLKREGLASELSPAVLDTHRAIEAALDPAGILNPGKVFG